MTNKITQTPEQQERRAAKKKAKKDAADRKRAKRVTHNAMSKRGGSPDGSRYRINKDNP